MGGGKLQGIQDLLVQAQTTILIEQYDAAMELCVRVLNIEPKNIQALTIAGIASLALDNPDSAEVYCSNAIGIAPINGELHFMLGNALFGQQRISEALQSYAKAERYGCSDDSKKKLYYLMGLINQIQGQPKAALVNYKKSLAIQGANADQADILLKCTQLCVEAHNFDEAETYAIQIKFIKPDVFKSYELLFQILLQQRKIDEAFVVLEDAEKSCPEVDSANIALYRALLHSVLAEIEQKNSEAHYKDALNVLHSIDLANQTSEKQLDIILSKAELYLKQNDVERACKYAEEATRISHSDNLSESFDKANFILLECLKNENEYDDAMSYAVKLKESKNGFYRCHGLYTVAWLIREQKGEAEAKKPYAEAIAFYRASTARNPADMIAFSYRIRSYSDIGQKEKAQELCSVLPEEMRKELMKYVEQSS